jgi:NADH:ubiquinone oxidoreductase subunit F (NADH-binding)
MNLSEQIDTAEDQIIKEIEAAKLRVQGDSGFSTEHMIYFIKESEFKQTDHMHECLDRLRFLTSRVELIEGAIGGKYMYGTDQEVELYDDGYFTDLIAPNPHNEDDVVDSYFE